MQLEANFLHPVPDSNVHKVTCSICSTWTLTLHSMMTSPCIRLEVILTATLGLGLRARKAGWEDRACRAPLRWVYTGKARSHSDLLKLWTLEDKGKRRHGRLKDSQWGVVRCRCYKTSKTLSIWSLWRAHGWYFLWYDEKGHSCICKKSGYKICSTDTSLSLVKLQVYRKKDLFRKTSVETHELLYWLLRDSMRRYLAFWVAVAN